MMAHLFQDLVDHGLSGKCTHASAALCLEHDLDGCGGSCLELLGAFLWVYGNTNLEPPRGIHYVHVLRLGHGLSLLSYSDQITLSDLERGFVTLSLVSICQ